MNGSDKCEKERKALEHARKALLEHESNPLQLDKGEESFRRVLERLESEVATAEEALRACESAGS